MKDNRIVRSWNTAEVVIRCAKIMREPGDFGTAVSKVLAELADVIKPERLYIVRNTEFGQNVAYEWTAPGKSSAKEIFSALSGKVISEFDHYVQKNPGIPMILEDIEELKEAEPETYREMKKRKLKNMLSVSLYYDNKIFGNIACDNFNNNKLYDIRELVETVAFFHLR